MYNYNSMFYRFIQAYSNMLKHIKLKYVKHIKYIDKYINYKRKYKRYFLDFKTDNILYK